MMKVVIARRAARDINDNFNWMAEHSQSRANRWRDRILSTLDTFEENPERFPLAPEDQFYEGAVREFLAGKRPHLFRILFEIRVETVVILRIRHTKRDKLRPEEL